MLNLAESNLQDQSIPLLGRLPQLKHVDLSATGLSDDAVDDLIHACRELKELRSMDLRATKISQPAARALPRRLQGQHVAVVRSAESRYLAAAALF